MESKEEEPQQETPPISIPAPEEISRAHKFWDTQPMPKLSTLVSKNLEMEQGPLDPPKTVDDVRQEPYRLHSSLEWVSVDVMDEEWMEQLYKLLTENYVEDDDALFRFDYSPEFLRWALTPEGYRQEFHVGVAVKGTKRLVGFISGIPARVNVYGQSIEMVEINFLCVYKKYRQNRLAPVLIKEVTRRVNLTNVWQAVYTAGVVIPTPIGQARYWHRSLDPIKLVEIGFTRFGPKLNNARAKKLYKLPEEPQIPGFRAMRESDVESVHQLLMDYLSRFSLYVEFSISEIAHFFLERHNVVYSYVVEDESGQITDFCSFYSLPSSCLRSTKHEKLNAAYSYYNVPGAHTIMELFKDMLIVAKSKGFDVFNALDIMENSTVFNELKFGIGDGNLQYYLYNWRCGSMKPSQIGLVLV